MINFKVQQGRVTTNVQTNLGRRAELAYAEAMNYSAACLPHGTEAKRVKKAAQKK